MILKNIKLKDLKAHPDGCRTHQSHTALMLATSVKTFGGLLRIPFVLNQRTGNLIDGDQMREALALVPGYTPETEVPVWVVDIPEELEDAAHLALQNHAGEWEWPQVSDMLKRQKDATVTGFPNSKILALISVEEWEPKLNTTLDGADSQQSNLL
jgi:hypothetical protein